MSVVCKQLNVLVHVEYPVILTLHERSSQWDKYIRNLISLVKLEKIEPFSDYVLLRNLENTIHFTRKHEYKEKTIDRPTLS
jgi:hypothetical protein